MGANEGGWFGVENDVVVMLVLVVAIVQYHRQGGQVWGLNPKTELPGLNFGECTAGGPNNSMGGI